MIGSNKRIKNKELRIKNSGNGYTLIELMVSVSIFAIIAVILTQIFVLYLRQNQSIYEISSLIDKAMFLSRRTNLDLRSAKINEIDIRGGLSINSLSFQSEDLPTCQIINYSLREAFQLFVNVVLRNRQDIDDSTICRGTYITSPNMNIEQMKFYKPVFEGINPGVSRITYEFIISHKLKPLNLNLQTTITQRRFLKSPANNLPSAGQGQGAGGGVNP